MALRILGFTSISYRLRGFLDFASQVTNGRANGWIPWYGITPVSCLETNEPRSTVNKNADNLPQIVEIIDWLFTIPITLCHVALVYDRSIDVPRGGQLSNNDN